MPRGTIRIAAFGDVVGNPGRHVLEKHLNSWRQARAVDLVVVNGENIADGSGVTPALMDRLLRAGVDVVTSGDHIGRKNQIFPVLQGSPKIVRPANYPDAFPGRGLTFATCEGGVEVGVLNVIGRVFMQGEASCPFHAADAALRACEVRRVKILVVDFHAEATSEKIAMGWHLDGRASFVFGSHTHVATADGRVLPQGTAYQTDLGMCGPHDGVIGRMKERVIKKLMTGIPTPFDVAEGDERANGALVEVDATTGRALSIERVEIRMDDPVPAEVGLAACRAGA
jgi:metallophosphoesterase (TIGR00282 family)